MAHVIEPDGRTGRREPKGAGRPSAPAFSRRPGAFAAGVAGLLMTAVVCWGQAPSPLASPYGTRSGAAGPTLMAAAQPAVQPNPPAQPPVLQPGPGPTVGDILGATHPRLSGLPSSVKPPVGTAPVPNRETQKLIQDTAGMDFVDPVSTIEVVVGRPRIWRLKQTPIRIQVGDPRILDYQPIGNDLRQLSIIGQAQGITVLNMWFGDRDDPKKQTILSFQVNVLPDPEAKERLERVYKALEDEINRSFPDAFVCLFLVGDKLVVTGQVKDAVEATQILQILRANAPTSGPQGAANIPVQQAVLNLGAGGVDPITGELRQSLDSYVIQGEQNVINLLRIPGEQQVMLKVTVAEVSRAAARSIGLNEIIRNSLGVQVFSNTTGQGKLQPNLNAILDNGRVSLAIDALRNVNLARSLAEPNLVTLNGRPAFFQAGGEFPVPVVTGATAVGLQGVQFVPFGVQLNFIPYISDKDRIQLQLNATVSVRDVGTGANFGTGATANNTTFVPGLTTRTVSTTVQMREGQTLAIAGLLQTNLGNDTTRVPLFGDIPFGGQLFRVDRSNASESELVLLVTPELVHAMEPKEVPPLPGSDVFEPGDLEFYLLGRLESRRPYDYRSPVMSDPARMCAYRRCELLYFAGPHGHSDPDGH
jgi:pilus assembly protein CpaC